MSDTRLAPQELPGDEYAWGVEVMLAFDCFCNALLRGWHRETLSSRAWRAWTHKAVFGWLFRPLIDVLFAWQSFRLDHCERHFEAEVARAALIVEVRKNDS